MVSKEKNVEITKEFLELMIKEDPTFVDIMVEMVAFDSMLSARVAKRREEIWKSLGYSNSECCGKCSSHK